MTAAIQASYALPAIVNMDSVSMLVDDLRAIDLPENGVLQMDASALELITTCGLQALISANRSLRDKNARLSIVHAGLPLRDACRICGLSDEFDNWTAG